MPKLVADYIKALGETIKQDAIAIAVYHLAAIPKGDDQQFDNVESSRKPRSSTELRL